MSATTREATLGRSLTDALERSDVRAALWGNRLLGATAVAAIGTVTALVSSVPMPRGPVTAGQGLAVIGVSLLVGAAAGYLMRSRWAAVLMPLAYIGAYELARVGIGGASLGPIRVDPSTASRPSPPDAASTASWPCYLWSWVSASASPSPAGQLESSR